MVAQYKDPVAAAIEIDEYGESSVRVIQESNTAPNLSVPFLKERATVTLAADATVGSNIITLVGGHGVTVGEEIELAKAGTIIYMQAQVVNVSVNTITLDCPVNYPYLTTDIAIASSKNLLVDGSVTPQIFSILPLPGQAGDIIRIIIEIRGKAGSDMDFTTFGSEAALTNGCVLRVKKSDGYYTNLFNFKSNSDFFEQGYDHSFSLPKFGNSIAGFTARVTWGGANKQGSVIRVDGSMSEEIQLIVQDDLTGGNTRFHLTAQGHELSLE